MPARSDRPLLAWARFLIPLVLLALFVRTVVAVPRVVPTGSMIPALLPGDLLLVKRWPDRLGGAPPRRGEVVVVRTPSGDVVKRVIARGGDRVAIRNGRVVLNGRPVARFPVADIILPVDRASPCPVAPDDRGRCRLRRFREILPGGDGHAVLDLDRSAGDAMPEVRVPAGRLFLLGDNRDRSDDSRGTLGLVAEDALVGRAWFLIWSSTGRGSWWRPGSWSGGVRRDRIGLVP